MGFSADIATPGGPVHLALAFNPSHLEIVDPAVVGSVRSRQHLRGDAERKQVLPILLHGDAAVAAHGVVLELIQMSRRAVSAPAARCPSQTKPLLTSPPTPPT